MKKNNIYVASGGGSGFDLHPDDVGAKGSGSSKLNNGDYNVVSPDDGSNNGWGGGWSGGGDWGGGGGGGSCNFTDRDRTKLNSILPGAQVNQDAVSSIKTNEGVYQANSLTAEANLIGTEGNHIFVDEEGNIIVLGNDSKIPYIIKKDDPTLPTDENVFSALRSIYQFLRKDLPDSTEHIILFLDGAEFGDFVNSFLFGKGGAVDEQGNAQLESLEVRSYLKVLELIYNRLTAVEGDVVFTESGVIDEVEQLSENTYRLTLRKRWDGDFTALQLNDVIRGVVNNLMSTGEYYTSWARILSVNTSSNEITVITYPPEETPAKKNFEPGEGMVLHRWGNATNPERLMTWYLSSTEGRIAFLDGVTKPILEDYNYASFWGKPLKLKIFEGRPINYDHPYTYMRGAIILDLIRVDYNGKPVITYIDRGKWKEGTIYHDGSEYPYECDDVWLHNCKWRCIVKDTTQKPGWDSTDWALIQGDETLSLTIDSSNGILYRPNSGFHTTLSATVYLGTEDITKFVNDKDWSWNRDTGRPTQDNAWADLHKDTTNELKITEDDLGRTEIGVIIFKCTVFIRDGEEILKIEKEIIV